MLRLIGRNINKKFDGRKVIQDVSFEISAPHCLGITGKNGSGKSTLIKMLAGLLVPDNGEIRFEKNGKVITQDDLYGHIGFIAPYLQLYDEFSSMENLMIFDNIRGIKKERSFYIQLLKKVQLGDRRNDQVKTFSSGMKQRLKIAFAISGSPDILLFDEPTSNLDEDGINLVREVMTEQKKDKILVVASNDKNDYFLFDSSINLD